MFTSACFTNSLNIIFFFIYEVQYQSLHKQHASQVAITISLRNLAALRYAAFHFLLHFCFPCRAGRGNFHLWSSASFNIDDTCPTIFYTRETTCQPHLALTIYQYQLTHVKISFFFISVNISKTRVKNSRKANRRGTLKEETYIFCVLGSPCSHKTRILIVQRLSSLMESEASFSPCLCCVRFEYSSVSGINSNEIFCFLPAICCLLAVLKGTAWLKWLQMEILLYNTDSRSHIKHLRWVCKTSKKQLFALNTQISLYALTFSLICHFT